MLDDQIFGETIDENAPDKVAMAFVTGHCNALSAERASSLCADLRFGHTDARVEDVVDDVKVTRT